MYPRQSPTTHTEQLGDEASVYDWARAQVHALNPTAARVWRQCDGATSPDAIAAALRRETGIAEAEALVDLTLRQLARVHLLELPAESRGDRPATTRRWLLSRGVAAAMLPAISSIVAPTPLAAQSPQVVPTLTSISPPQGVQGTTVAVTLIGTNFVVGATTVNVSGTGVTVNTVVVSGPTSLTANFVLDPAAALGARTVTVTTAGGTSGGQSFTVNPPPPTLTSVSPNQGIRGTTVPVTLTGTNFVVGATTVTVAGGSGVTVANVVVSGPTSLTADFVLDLAVPAVTPRTVTVMTAGGTSGGQTFTIILPASGSQTFGFTGSAVTFAVPAGVVSVTIVAAGAGGAAGTGAGGGLGGQTTATVPVTPGASLTVRVGGAGTSGGFNGGGSASSIGMGGRGGGASSVHDGATLLVIAGGGGGGGARPGATGSTGGGSGGAGGGLIADPGETAPSGGGGGGGGGTQAAGGAGGTSATGTGTAGAAGVAGIGGSGGTAQSGVVGGGGGGGGYFGGGGGGGGNPGVAGGGGGGGGSSFTAPAATGIAHVPGVKAANGSVMISW